MGTCSTIFEFWTCYDIIPKPSQLFYQKDIGKPYYYTKEENVAGSGSGTGSGTGTDNGINATKREMASISVFKSGIFPNWEDPQNKKGGEIEYRLKSETNIDFMDKLWLYLCMNCMSEQISDSITGFRLVDSSIMAQSKPLYRVEIWFSDLNQAKQIETKFREIFSIEPDVKLNTKKHS